jgi:hypothetical protein
MDSLNPQVHVDTAWARACLLSERLRGNSWDIVNATPLPVLYFQHSLLGNDPGAYAALVAELQHPGHVWVSATRLRGQPDLRAGITSYLTTEDGPRRPH